MNRDEVFILLVGDNGECETWHSGTLHTEKDPETDRLRDITIEGFSQEDENLYNYIDEFDDPHPINREVVFKPDEIIVQRRAYEDTESYSNSADELRETDSREVEERATVIRGALHVFERVSRGEPILIGWKDLSRQREMARGRHGPFGSPALALAPPPARRRRPGLRARAAPEPLAPAQSRLVRVSLETHDATSGWPWMELDLVIRPDGYVAKVHSIFGRAGSRRDTKVQFLSIDDFGFVEWRGSARSPRPFVLDLFARNLNRLRGDHSLDRALPRL